MELRFRGTHPWDDPVLDNDSAGLCLLFGSLTQDQQVSSPRWLELSPASLELTALPPALSPAPVFVLLGRLSLPTPDGELVGVQPAVQLCSMGVC